MQPCVYSVINRDNWGYEAVPSMHWQAWDAVFMQYPCLGTMQAPVEDMTASPRSRPRMLEGIVRLPDGAVCE